MFVIASTTSRLPIAQPMRKPVIAYIFETPWTTTSFEASPVSFAKSYGFGRLLAVEDEPVVEVVHDQPEVLLLAELDDLGDEVRRVHRRRDGLFGLLRMTAFV